MTQNNRKRLLMSIDIGSTRTKGALFLEENCTLKLLKRYEQPTNQKYLSTGFAEVYTVLQAGNIEKHPVITRFSSSAHGGLKMAAIGIIPTLTVKAAQQAAVSAGAKLQKVISHRITADDIHDLEADPPDIILMSGGTDGGNQERVIEYVKKIAASNLKTQLLYAGNSMIREEITKILKPFEDRLPLTITDNVLPVLDTYNPEGARSEIQRLFLSMIMQKKGLVEASNLAEADPMPTPASMLKLVQLLRENLPDFEDFCLVDVGGATTDCYSSTHAHISKKAGVGQVLFRGLPEPKVKRTVEGDLGMRFSAGSTIEAFGTQSFSRCIERELRTESTEAKDQFIYDQAKLLDDFSFKRYVERITRDPSIIAETQEDLLFDSFIATIAVEKAIKRHSGELKSVYTADGPAYLQYGKDLSQVKKLICTGGIFTATALLGNRVEIEVGNSEFFTSEIISLTPEAPEIYYDREYLLPLVANIAELCPEAAAKFVIQNCLTSGFDHNPEAAFL